MFFWGPYTLILILITCGCNIGIWKKFQTERVAASHKKSRDSQNKRLTKTLLIVSGLTLLAWLPLVLLNLLMYVWFFHVPRRFYHAVNLFNYLNSFVNPIFYALRIAEFRRALALCCRGRHVQAAQSFLKEGKRGTERLLSLVVNWLLNKMLWILRLVMKWLLYRMLWIPNCKTHNSLARNSIKMKYVEHERNNFYVRQLKLKT